MATHSSILSCEIPWTEEPGGLSDPTERLMLPLPLCSKKKEDKRLDAMTRQLKSGIESQRTLQRNSHLLHPWGFSRQEYWSGLPCPPPGDLRDPEIEPMSLMPPILDKSLNVLSISFGSCKTWLILSLQGLKSIRRKRPTHREALAGKTQCGHQTELTRILLQGPRKACCLTRIHPATDTARTSRKVSPGYRTTSLEPQGTD